MTYLPPGCTTPDSDELNAFWATVLAETTLTADSYTARWIGLDRESTFQVFELIKCGDKTGTFTLPWIIEAAGDPEPVIGDAIILIDIDGHPHQVIQITDIEQVAFGDITAEHTSVDGSPVRDLSIWKPLHTSYWNAMLAPFGKQVDAAMPVWVERVTLIYS